MGPVVSEKMHYSLKPISVESKAHVLTLPCIGTNMYKGDTSNTIVFHIQHNQSGRYIDPQATWFKCTLKFTFPETFTPSYAFFLEHAQSLLFMMKSIHSTRHSGACFRRYR